LRCKHFSRDLDIDFTIGQLAQDSGCSVPTIRYYEQEGLLARALRGAIGHRRYRDQDLQRLVFIQRCRDFAFPLEQVKASSSTTSPTSPS
jgi:MerR family transcriptional regulator, copper efflux regulator